MAGGKCFQRCLAVAASFVPDATLFLAGGSSGGACVDAILILPIDADLTPLSLLPESLVLPI